MDNLAEMLSQMMNSPEGMERIKNLANMLGQNQASSAPQASGRESAVSPPAVNSAPSSSGSNPLGGLGGIDTNMLQMMTKLAPLLSIVRQEDDSTRLLHALRPLLSGERQKKVDEAIKILRLMRMVPLIKDAGIFSDLL